MKELQVGGLGSGNGRVQITNQIWLNKDDTEKLMEINNKGTKVHLRAVPKEEAISIERAAKKIL